MSVRVMSWVWESSRSEGIDRLVLLAIADCAADHGGDSWPSIATLVDKTKLGERTVQRAIKRLAELGELTVKSNAGKHGVNVYRIDMSHPVGTTPRHRDTPSERHPVDESKGGVRDDVDPRQSDTRTVLEPSIKATIQQPSSSEPAPRADVDALCTHLADRIEANGSKRPTIGQRWRDAARRLIDIDGRTEQQIHAAIDWCQGDEFWRSNILSMPKLREKYEQMRLQASRTTNGGKPSTTDQRVHDALTLADRLARKAIG
jgi:hypothetical protein